MTLAPATPRQHHSSKTGAMPKKRGLVASKSPPSSHPSILLMTLTPPPGSDAVCAALDLPSFSGAEYTEAFVLLAPPHAAIHLGTEGKLGGDALDRVEGFWRALGASDHLQGSSRSRTARDTQSDTFRFPGICGFDSSCRSPLMSTSSRKE